MAAPAATPVLKGSTATSIPTGGRLTAAPTTTCSRRLATRTNGMRSTTRVAEPDDEWGLGSAAGTARWGGQFGDIRNCIISGNKDVDEGNRFPCVAHTRAN